MDFGSILPTIENLSKLLLPVRMIDDNQQGICRTWGKSCGPRSRTLFIPLVQSISYGITDGPIDFDLNLSAWQRMELLLKGLIYRIHNVFCAMSLVMRTVKKVCTGRGIVAENSCVIDTLEEIRTKKVSLKKRSLGL